MGVDISGGVRYRTDRAGALCFRHAVIRATQGENVRSEFDTDFDSFYPICVDCNPPEAMEKECERCYEEAVLDGSEHYRCNGTHEPNKTKHPLGCRSGCDEVRKLGNKVCEVCDSRELSIG